MSNFSSSNKRAKISEQSSSSSGSKHQKPSAEESDSDDVYDDLDEDGEEMSGSEEDDDEEDTDIKQLPRMFYEYACTQVEELNDLATTQKALISLEKAKTLILETNEDLKTLVAKALKRKEGDTKVPPGSNLVERKISDLRYLLNLICILQAKICVTQNDHKSAMKMMREALIWFPRSIEGNYLSGEILRGHAATSKSLTDAENFYIKAVDTTSTLQKSVNSNSTTVPSQLQQHLAANMQKANSSSSSASNIDKTAAKIDDDSDEEYNQDLVDQEFCCGNKAVQALILYYCQTEGSENKAYKYLVSKGFKLKLSNQVLQYPLSNNSVNNSSTSSIAAEAAAVKTDTSSQYVSILNDVMTPNILAHLSHVFRSDSPFWSEHHYDTITNASKTVGYFSYLYPMRERSAMSSIEQVCSHKVIIAGFSL